MFLSLCLAVSFCTSHSPIQEPKAVVTRTVALLPWSLAAGTDGARETVKKAIHAVFEKGNYEVIPEARTKRVWEEVMNQPPLLEAPEHENEWTAIPSPKKLLELGKKMGVDLVCAGRAKWHTKSVWVAFGPKTKAHCTVDVVMVDVAKGEVILQATNIRSDSTKSESGLETAGALLLTMGITGLSGGPVDPHQRKAGALAVAIAFDPWLSSMKRKISE